MYNTELKTQSKALGQNIKENVLSDRETWWIADKVRILSGHYQLGHSEGPPVTKVEKLRTLKETLSRYFCLLYLNVGSQGSWKLNTYSSQQLLCTQI